MSLWSELEIDDFAFDVKVLLALYWVVRISACHVEGPGSIPGRGETLLFPLKRRFKNMMLQVRLELTTPAFLVVLSISTVR